jgi:hypothetical protein
MMIGYPAILLTLFIIWVANSSPKKELTVLRAPPTDVLAVTTFALKIENDTTRKAIDMTMAENNQK